MSRVKALVMAGYGINCEKEMALACQKAGAESSIVHTHHLLNRTLDLKNYHLICFPGGFAFGDELGAAKVLANRFSKAKQALIKELQGFVAEGKCLLGICNGFQLLVKLGLLPGNDAAPSVTLTYNDHSHFDNRWIGHQNCSSKCVFTKGIDEIVLPIRHGEGKLVFHSKQTLEETRQRDQIVFRYTPDNPNGSEDNIAALCDETGRILGMMAHPEAALYHVNHPDWIKTKERVKREGGHLPLFGDGMEIFKNGVDYLKGIV